LVAKRLTAAEDFSSTLDQLQDMDIDAPLTHGIQEHNNDTSNYHNNSSSHVYHSESSMNFDYLQGLRADAAAASTSSAASGSSSNNVYGVVDDSRALDRLLFLTT